jgi:hypothetical protein
MATLDQNVAAETEKLIEAHFVNFLSPNPNNRNHYRHPWIPQHFKYST